MRSGESLISDGAWTTLRVAAIQRELELFIAVAMSTWLDVSKVIVSSLKGMISASSDQPAGTGILPTCHIGPDAGWSKVVLNNQHKAEVGFVPYKMYASAYTGK